MSAFEHSRHRIFNPGQHPYRHSLSEFAYSNPIVPSATNLEDAMNYIFAVLYPRYIATVANQAALAAYVGMAANDYIIVTDDGDGKSAGYVYSTIEGVSQWIKRYDVDWSVEDIFAEATNRTQYMYVHKYGFTDHDASGTAITGTYAGQTIYGGDATTQNLTLNANSADSTGYVQTDNTFRPTANNSLDLGTTLLKFRTGYFGTSALVGNITISDGSIVSSSGAISFDNENLSTTGDLSAANVTGTTSVRVSSGGNLMTLSAGSIVSATGAITFDNENLSTTGTLASGNLTVSGDLLLASGSITSASGAIDFGNENLSTSGTLGAGDITGTRVNADNLRLDGNTLSATNVDGNLILVANGAGVVDIQSAMTTIGQTVTGTLAVTGQLNADNLRLDGNVLSSTNTDGNITLTPNGTGIVEVSANFLPATDAARSLGTTTKRFTNLHMSGSIGDGTNNITIADLLALRNTVYRDAARTQPAQNGDALFYNSASGTWLASVPDTEVDHGSVSGLSDDDHTQYALLAGRSGGQTLNGSTAASEHLTLDSTAHATKGFIKVKSSVVADTDASYGGSWSGTDLGGSSNYFRDLYTKGELKNGRIENFANSGALPAAGASTRGRAAFDYGANRLYLDTGSAWLKVSVGRFISDTSWNGTDLTKDVTVSSTIEDARNAIWQLCDNANDYERIYCSIKAISATQVRITLDVALAAGSYRLIGLE